MKSIPEFNSIPEISNEELNKIKKSIRREAASSLPALVSFDKVTLENIRENSEKGSKVLVYTVKFSDSMPTDLRFLLEEFEDDCSRITYHDGHVILWCNRKLENIEVIE